MGVEHPLYYLIYRPWIPQHVEVQLREGDVAWQQREHGVGQLVLAVGQDTEVHLGSENEITQFPCEDEVKIYCCTRNQFLEDFKKTLTQSKDLEWLKILIAEKRFMFQTSA